jgi:STE24 endopeptidase
MRWGVLAMGLVLLVGMGTRNAWAGQTSEPAPPEVNAPAAQAGQQAVYHLPPEKLAKAIAYSRERSIFHFVDAFWGLAVLWLLLSTRAAAGMEALGAGSALFCRAACGAHFDRTAAGYVG